MALRALLNLASDRVFALPLAVVYLTDRCNSKCITCDYWKNGERQMSAEVAEKLAEAFARARVREVLFSGGEPTIHPQWTAIVDRFAGRRLLVTNGLSARRHAAEMERFQHVFVSLDGGTAPTYAAIRGVDGLDAILDGVRALRGRGIPVTLRTTLQRRNCAEVADIVARAAEVDAKVSFLAVDTLSHAFARREDWQRDLAPGADAIDALERAVPDLDPDWIEGGHDAVLRLVAWFRAIDHGQAPVPTPCNAPRISAVFEPDGQIRPCYFLPEVARFDGDLLGALNTPAFRAIRGEQRRGERPECATCVCTLRRGVRDLIRA